LGQAVQDEQTAIIHSPVGLLAVTAHPGGLCRIVFLKGRTVSETGRGSTLLRRACRQLGEYFAGTRKVFDLPLDLSFGTPFQQAVWRACAAIPFGKTCSYGDLATAAGYPGAARAVGNALNANRLPVVIPCHRVIAADGTLGGFGAGLKIKRGLLCLEGF
jgi:methylated-DNA-[protein]-cysteine S-methyltransferase